MKSALKKEVAISTDAHVLSASVHGVQWRSN